MRSRWGWLLPGVDWRNLGLTPQFDVNAPLATRMWKAATGQSVDGVMALDVTGLKELLAVTGPVTTANGTVVAASGVDQLLLHDQYAGEDYTTGSPQASRVDQLGSLAAAVLHALETQPLALQAIWRSTGVSGQLTADSLMADVINRGGNKLDQYLSVGTNLHLVSHGAQTAATLTITVANHTPPGQSPFIAGPYPGLGGDLIDG